MPDIDYLKIFRDAWKITRKNRFLWWFGLFLLLSTISTPNYFFPSDEKSKELWRTVNEKIHLQEFISQHAVVIGIVFTSLFLFFLALNLIARGALIKSTQKILQKKSINFKLGFREGRRYFWNIFIIFFFIGLLVAVCFFVLFLPIMMLVLAKSYVVATMLAILASVFFIALVILCKYLQTYGCFYVALANIRPWLAIENAYALFKKNILASIIMSLLFIPLSIFSFLVFIIIALIVLVVFGIIGVILFSTFKEIGAIIAIITGLITLISSLIIFYAFFSALSQVAWVLFFYAIATPKEKEAVAEKIVTPEKISALNNAEAIKTFEIKIEE